jgi:hypothetical protein
VPSFPCIHGRQSSEANPGETLLSSSCEFGPIHRWIYDQVRRVETRGDALVAALETVGVSGLREAWADILSRHPGSFAETELESLIGDKVDESMEAIVATVCAREAQLYLLAREAGEKAMLAFSEAFIEDARKWGVRTCQNLPRKDARTLFASLRELWLEGMPCFVEMDLPQDHLDRVEWTRQGLPLARYWSLTGSDLQGLLDLHCRWMATFVSSCGGEHRFDCLDCSRDPEAEFRFAISRAEGR